MIRATEKNGEITKDAAEKAANDVKTAVETAAVKAAVSSGADGATLEIPKHVIY